MSYDLAVFVPRVLGDSDVRSLVREISGLDIGTAVAGSLEVMRGARRRYCFTIDGPAALEAEDVPAEIASVVLGARWLYSVNVEGSAESEIPYALRFAKLLAQALEGAAKDQQTDEVWSRSRSRSIQRPARESRVAAVDLEWFCLRGDLQADVPSLYIDTVQRHLPEAVPRRFGEYEPLQGKYGDSGFDGFMTAWTQATSLLFFAGSGPCIGGSLAAGPNERIPGRFWSMSLRFLAEPLADLAWRDAVRRLFISMADGLPAFYASATVTRNHIWSGRSLWSDGDSEWPIRLRSREGWMGLSPVPTWWTWLGRPYRDLSDQLPPAQAASTHEGVLLELASVPTGADGLEPLSRWLPSDLFAALGPNPHRQQPVPLVRAGSIPESLA